MEYNFPSVIFESDCKILIEMISGSSSLGCWEIQAIVEDIKSWARDRQWSFVWGNRSKNKAAHWIATSCLDRKITSSTGCILPELKTILCKSSLWFCYDQWRIKKKKSIFAMGFVQWLLLRDVPYLIFDSSLWLNSKVLRLAVYILKRGWFILFFSCSCNIILKGVRRFFIDSNHRSLHRKSKDTTKWTKRYIFLNYSLLSGLY